ncbi:cyclic nucleotide-gated ion channel 1-like isoform X1 [Durio zibethinus]|uniref:Cyclic nucleotide-gated ion channel 1-like isoform X1 n=1 Tax=Durio zibethinus TaxID=66656 RepID=A0A6P6B0J6_DURZI|nr:cyclic nucleotide-gated ion channel 1-like isoform X1 [Durio zibethinus]XP_022770565.1 cyclic nucleotide-gated ion channel 1-like isoform X1 [Durio zibethinus]XP_022770567.1 cyclic nucleotide-gated ion channel 1-like isoform X1 [Durio zibethinus]XP_022770568.1 cyclic nucleotide-gated ion channel 1-like isoform X1 [Durio zibethinus]
MNFRRDKFVRFQDWSSDDGSFPMKVRPSLNAAMDGLRRVFEKSSERVRSLKKPISFRSSGNKPTKEKALGKGSRNRILNPQGQFLQTWNKMFLLSCAIALAVDPLFFYIPVIDGRRKCLNLDDRLEITACVLRTFIDVFYILHMIFQFRTAFVAPPSRVFGRGELIEDPRAIAKRYLSKYFFFDFLAILPLPQVVILIIIPTIDGPVSLITKELLKSIIFCQYVPRIIRIFPLYKEVTRTSGILTETAWAGAALNLFLYMLASHIVGAFWYLFSIEREDTCWRNAIGSGEESALYCDKHGTTKNATLVSLLNTSCPFTNPDDIKDPEVFNFGIFIDALNSGVVETWDFPKKFFYCFWWGLRNLSSLGQNLKTSTFVWEIFFAIGISIAGLVLFSLLIGNMQKYLQSTGVRIEEMRVKRQDAEQWMSHRMLPENLRERIRRYEQYKWQETRGVEEETLMSNLPKDLKRDIKRHLCLDLLKRVPMFEKMDEQLLDAMCDRLKPALYTDKSYIVREGDPVEEMLFIIRGNLVSTTTNGGRTGFFNAVYLKAGDFCGDDLLTWALDPQSSSNLPISTRTVQAVTEVEAFGLMAGDLKFVASQFRRLHSKQFQHTFKFYSVQWQTWAASFIQAAWRRHCKRKLVNSLREAEDKLQDALSKESGTSPSLGATLYASKFAANALRTLRNNGSQSARFPQRLPSLLPQKPAEPHFTAEDS